ncbi:MAG: electron transfer flavoprotein subunit alpha/FixB family protein [Syntrophaceae bacterium]
MADQKNILVIGELDRDKLSSTTLEMLSGAGQLAGSAGGEVHLLLFGEGSGGIHSGIGNGADKVYVAAAAAFNEYNSDACTSLAADLCRKQGYALCLLEQSDLGRDLAPRLAARLDAGLCMDCVEVKYDPEKKAFIQTRPAYGGKAMAVHSSPEGRLQVNTIRPKSMPVSGAEKKARGEMVVLREEIDPAGMKVRLLEFRKQETSGARLEDAKIIVAGGGGLGGPDGFNMIKELADALGGVVGATRVPVDENWVPLSMEIGQTGKIVSPQLYIAIGISGAAQHITGILSSKKIVTINRDPDANMFKISDLGIVADYKAVVPGLIKKLKELNA